jgi:hypothetical protein
MRRLAATVLALSLTGALLVGAGPAFAQDPVPTRGAVDDAAFDAAFLLATRPDCFRTLSRGGNPTPPDNLNPSTVLGRVPPIAISATPLRNFAASVAVDDIGRGTAGPGRGQITVYPRFSTFDYNPDVFDTSAITLRRVPTIADMQILAILHEIAHLTGALPAEANLGPLPPHFPQDAQQGGQVFNTKILVYCLRAADFNASTPPVRIAGLGCHTIYSIGGRRFACEASWTGGTDPVVLAWSNTDYAGPTSPVFGGRSQNTGHCPSGYLATNTVTLKVTDARGWTDELTVPTGCPV